MQSPGLENYHVSLLSICNCDYVEGSGIQVVLSLTLLPLME